MVTPTKKVNIIVSQGKGYLWDVEDVQTVRIQHHICGTLTGSLPQVGQQNVFLGLPLLLLPEEVVLLVNNNLATLTDDVSAHLPPTSSQSESYHSLRKSAIEKQRLKTVTAEEEKRVRAAELFKDQISKKKKEKEGKGKAKAVEGDAKPESFDVHVPDLAEGAKTTGPPSTPKPRDLATVPYTIVIQPSSIDAPWYDPSKASYATLEAAKEAGVWNYPETELQASRCKVFEDLWRNGYYMGIGLRFGGDFLVYPGDPLRYHSHFTLTVLPSPSSPIMPLDLVAYGRLATAVKKAHLLASWDAKAEKAEYFSLEWAAFG
ncbi:tRNA-intron endonuclease [Pseudohyphozyma bogoriensis]|nr:tRNA-intron endonuclease [Pseudohyphozyma bogoriensis]